MNNNVKNLDKVMNNIISNIKKNNNEMEMTLSKKTLDYIQKFSNSSTEMIKEFLGKNTEQIRLRNENLKLYKYDNLFLVLSDGKNAFNLEQNLKTAGNNSAIPKFATYFELGKNEFLTILEGDKETLIPYPKAITSISSEIKKQFKTSIQDCLNKTFQINKEIFANKEPLYWAKGNKNIIYGDWSQLSVAESNLSNYFKNIIEKIPL